MKSFNNTYANLPSCFYQKTRSEYFSNPQLIEYNSELIDELGLNLSRCSMQELATLFSGQKLMKGMDPLAQVYAGFQFGNPVSQLGDGRALLLGEINNCDIQLKGSGRTAFSRGGDGRSALGPVLREYIVSEAMNRFKVPTTRALAAVTTGEQVMRQFGPEPGGIFTRVATSHLRVGTFQYFAFKEDWQNVEILLNYTIRRHYPKLLKLSNIKDRALGLLQIVLKRQAKLIAQWSALGFIHGVMNTDNFSVAGITIDYGPCAFMDEFRWNKVFSSIDHQGRYSFWNQVEIAKWNILRFADTLLPLIDQNYDKSIEYVQDSLKPLWILFDRTRAELLTKKLGISNFDDSDWELTREFLEYLNQNELDFTLSFRHLDKLYSGDHELYPHISESWLNRWKERVDNIETIHDINPIYIPRNHQIQKVIDSAYRGQFEDFSKLNEVLNDPFQERKEYIEFAKAPTAQQKIKETFCGT